MYKAVKTLGTLKFTKLFKRTEYLPVKTKYLGAQNSKIVSSTSV